MSSLGNQNMRGRLSGRMAVIIGLFFTAGALAFSLLLPEAYVLAGMTGTATCLWLLKHRLYATTDQGGVWHHAITSRGWPAWILALFLTGLYCLIYWWPQWLGLGTNDKPNTGFIALFDPLSLWLKGTKASQWFAYGYVYTWVILLFGIDFIRKYRHVRYQVYRTLSVIFFQVCFAFLLPEILMSFQYPYFDVKHFWPLNYYFFFDWHLDSLIASGMVGWFMLFWGIAGFLIITPLLTWYYGKRWYCSWVCGCGALAETAGDSFRHLSDKSDKAWRLEQWMIYSIFGISILMTALVLYTRISGSQTLLGLSSVSVSSWYGFYIGSLFSGVAGVGLYPLLGNRIWCRFGCPLAAYMGLIQAFQMRIKKEGKETVIQPRFRISTNGGQCISCGQCSTSCEMGIDVKSYAQQGQDIVRASCVGCGICSTVCPRGVLNLELSPMSVFTDKTAS